jgi:hypothetical protein
LTVLTNELVGVDNTEITGGTALEVAESSNAADEIERVVEVASVGSPIKDAGTEDTELA